MQLRFKLNHYYQGQNAPFLYAQDAGLFAGLGVEVEFIEGFSSSQVTRALSEGAADIGFGDVTSVIESAMRNGNEDIRCLLPIYARSPCALGYHRRTPPLALADLTRAKLCAPQGDTSARLLPALLAINGFADLEYDIISVTPEERDQLVASREVLAATCFDATLKFAMRMRGHDSSDIEFLYFADHGLDAYSSAVIYSEKALQGDVSLKAGLAAVVRQAWSSCRRDPQLGVDAVMRRNADADPTTIRDQLEWVLDRQVYLPDRAALEFEHETPRWANSTRIARFSVSGDLKASPADMALAERLCDALGDSTGWSARGGA